MTTGEERDQRMATLLERLTRLSEAILRINDSLDLDAVLQRALDSARALTGAQYGVLTTQDAMGQMEDFLASGLSAEEAQQLWGMPGGAEIFEYVNAIPGPWRVADFAAHAREMGLPDFQPPTPMSSFLTVPILHRNDRVGSIHMAKRETGEEFDQEDEETLVMFGAQAAMVIANARRYRDEQRARTALETLVETSPVGVAVFDGRTGAPVSFNREVSRLIDLLREEDQPLERLLDGLTCKRSNGQEISFREWPTLMSMSGSEGVRAEEIVLSVPEGRSVTALLNAAPIRLVEGGEVESFVVTLQDLSPLEEQERLRAEFLGMVSHEMRAPLTSIRGSASTMLDASEELDPVELRQFLRIIVEQTDSMRDLIGDLLDVARIETGTLPVNPEPAEAASLVDRARNTFLSGGGRNSLDIKLSPDLPLVMADRRRIVQVVCNLLSNAARHSPDGSTIRVKVERREKAVAFSVADLGRGIPATQLPRLFRKFFRSESGDTGLGLAVCKGIVEAHGGRIWAESAGPGLGAQFTFTLPEVGSPRATRAPEPDEAQREAVEGDPILVVDDDPLTLRQVRKALSRAGYKPVVTADPDEAFRLLMENRPGLVLLDMMLPGTDAIELMQDMANISDAPVVFLSAYGGDQMIAQALEAGAADYVVKPFSPSELVARVGAAMRKAEWPQTGEAIEPYRYGELTIDYAQRRVTLGGERVTLTAKEYDMLRVLSVSGGRVVRHDRVLRRVWGPGKDGDVRAMRTLLRRLRRKLGEDGSAPTYIFAVPRVGYRMPETEG